MTQNVFEQITSGYYRLTTSEKKVADYVVLHPWDVQYMSISELAQVCEVAESTVSRFCRRLHFSNYSSFKIAIAAARPPGGELMLSGEVRPEDSAEELLRKVYTAHAETMRQAVGLLDPAAVRQAVDIFCQSRRVLCMGQGGSMLIAMEAAYLFAGVTDRFSSVEGAHSQAMVAALLDERDTVWSFSYSGSTRDTLDAMKIARSRKCRLVLLTHFPKSPGAEYADVVLQCAANEGPLQLGSVVTRVAQMYIVDVLYQAFCCRDPETTGRNRAAAAQALAQKHV